jgi:acetyl esterase/lipase
MTKHLFCAVANGSRRRVYVAIYLFVILLPPNGLVADEPIDKAPTHQDLEYARVEHKPLLLDLYLPKWKPTVSVIWVHGGAWRAGSKKDVPVLRWCDQGMAIASVDYRLSPEAPFPAQIHDIKAAIRWLREHSSRYQIDPNRIVVAGSSAGGHLAALVGVSNTVRELEGTVGPNAGASSDVQAIVSFFGASNLQTILSQSTPFGLNMRVPALELLLGGKPDQKPELAKLASPVSHVDDRDPPIWLIHGDQDPQMPINQSHELQGVYKQHKLPVQFEVVHGGKHGGAGFFTADQLDRIGKEVLAVFQTPNGNPTR